MLRSEEGDPDPDAIACYGFYRHDTRKVTGPVRRGAAGGDMTVQFLEWLCWGVAQEGKKVLVVIWDDASWHTCRDGGRMGGRAEPAGRDEGKGYRSYICELPVASPWLNNIEPCWTHAKKAVMEADRKLTAAEITGRVCEHFECELLPYLKSASPDDGADGSRTP